VDTKVNQKSHFLPQYYHFLTLFDKPEFQIKHKLKAQQLDLHRFKHQLERQIEQW
jgi:hypothetical protein